MDVLLQFPRRRLFGHGSIGCNDNRIVAQSVAKQVVVGQCPRAEGKGVEEGCEAAKHSGKGGGVVKDLNCAASALSVGARFLIRCFGKGSERREESKTKDVRFSI